jgi:hypothetical protein
MKGKKEVKMKDKKREKKKEIHQWKERTAWKN